MTTVRQPFRINPSARLSGNWSVTFMAGMQNSEAYRHVIFVPRLAASRERTRWEQEILCNLMWWWWKIPWLLTKGQRVTNERQMVRTRNRDWRSIWCKWRCDGHRGDSIQYHRIILTYTRDSFTATTASVKIMYSTEVKLLYTPDLPSQVGIKRVLELSVRSSRSTGSCPFRVKDLENDR